MKTRKDTIASAIKLFFGKVGPLGVSYEEFRERVDVYCANTSLPDTPLDFNQAAGVLAISADSLLTLASKYPDIPPIFEQARGKTKRWTKLRKLMDWYAKLVKDGHAEDLATRFNPESRHGHDLSRKVAIRIREVDGQWVIDRPVGADELSAKAILIEAGAVFCFMSLTDAFKAPWADPVEKVAWVDGFKGWVDDEVSVLQAGIAALQAARLELSFPDTDEVATIPF